ncbi:MULTISPECIES: GMC family oxidoreductase N-terminal domain-containing protein [unclassified Chelatococcus]|uniref:GMC family oxidoreductase n=1 Tax=unclassified Chelatococcus TaxID=2638111 RepID=UPI0020BF1D1A|nr:MULTISPECIES: GMC family oxidoreductase N-terminal domain-containing protein [unclassified Chelatococcus]MCO5074299.1 GMC family oxidoreductase N-terminal domain-containing protein [Chelatococcus sp.]
MAKTMRETETYDYIVVGGGSAGCVLASRLSEDLSVSVLLLEAGPADRNPWLHVPSGFFKTINNPRYDWRYQTEPEPGLKGRRVAWPRGRVLGGSSAINGLIYIRGQADDFNDWAQRGNPGWSWSDVLPAFKAVEAQARGESEYHGADGGLGVEDPAVDLELVSRFVKAGQQAGMPFNPDFNGATQEGVGRFQLTTRCGRRSSSARAFLGPAARRPNLRVLTGVEVHKLELEGRRVRGIFGRRAGEALHLRCHREIVLTAGAIGSPQILQLSGVGDPERLAAAGVAPVHALYGVGLHLQDHLQSRLMLQLNLPISLNNLTRGPWRKILIGMSYLLRRQGVLSFGASLAGGFARSPLASDRPDIQFHFQPLSLDSYDGGLHAFPGATISACQLRPESEGTIFITSPDPSARPEIRANYLASDLDRRTMVEGFRYARRIAAAPALAELVADEHRPGAAVQSDEEILDYIRMTGSSIYHPSGTCRMGPDPTRGDVVDARLRVHGLSGVRIADCSIMPRLISGNTNAAAIMIGERAAALIREDAAKSKGTRP